MRPKLTNTNQTTMNKLHAEKLWPIMKAYASGAEIQWWNGEDEGWVDHGNPTFAHEHPWRVKPQNEAFHKWWDENHAGWPNTEKELAEKAWEAAKKDQTNN
jgi:hypothetical protein